MIFARGCGAGSGRLVTAGLDFVIRESSRLHRMILVGYFIHERVARGAHWALHGSSLVLKLDSS